MKDKYIKPDFNRLKPSRINIANDKLKRSKYYNPDIELKPDKNRFKESLSKLRANTPLVTKDYKVLFYYLDDVEKIGLFKNLCDKFYDNIDNFRSHRSFLRPLISYVYNFYDESPNISCIYEMLLEVSKNLKDKEKYKHIKMKFKNSLNLRIFLDGIKKDFYYVITEEDIEDALKRVFMKSTDKFYLECMARFIIDNHTEKSLFIKFDSIVKKMPLNLKKEVFIGILDSYKYEKNIELYPSRWFDKIGFYLGDPYSTSNTKWIGIKDELKEVYRRWNNSKHLYEFFNQMPGHDNNERLEFWKAYMDNIYRIRHYNELNNALVMEFRSHVFVEFADPNNALYMYDRRVQNIDNIDKNIRGYRMSNAEKVKYLKNRTTGTAFIHRPGWQFKFNDMLRKLGYKKSRW